MLKSNVSRLGKSLCPFSWIQITKPSGCLSSIMGKGDQIVWEPQPCLEDHCKLWDESENNCGLLTKIK